MNKDKVANKTEDEKLKMRFTQDDLGKGICFEFSEIHSFFFLHKTHHFVLDIDFTYKVEPPENDGDSYRMWKAPATLTFLNGYVDNIELSYVDGIEVDYLERSAEPVRDDGQFRLWKWTIDSPRGKILVVASGFILELREEPKLIVNYPYVGTRLLSFE